MGVLIGLLVLCWAIKIKAKLSGGCRTPFISGHLTLLMRRESCNCGIKKNHNLDISTIADRKPSRNCNQLGFEGDKPVFFQRSIKAATRQRLGKTRIFAKPLWSLVPVQPTPGTTPRLNVIGPK
ncbi:hypothetical protein X474_10875 [Dethiosulfatarculus sandiegensis]|uniref:Uncharacterized protein n=1 Tax=Dethiosulfatarculus sandiegensis TaxID=1429043 RepID=A0A0D2HUC7_9BACT|nr:hypothetical protein X474_10875 [Dethiosulfatarculus sandiegensis]